MRCPDCCKMVSYDTDVEPEEQNEPEVEGEEVVATYRRVLTCGDCGTELKEAEIEVRATISNENLKLSEKAPCEADHEWTVKDSSVEPTTGVIDTDRNGKKITNSRYMKTTYGVELSGTAECEKCNAEADFNGSAEEIASSFSELV